jgi:hypothetical protein
VTRDAVTRDAVTRDAVTRDAVAVTQNDAPPDQPTRRDLALAAVEEVARTRAMTAAERQAKRRAKIRAARNGGGD